MKRLWVVPIAIASVTLLLAQAKAQDRVRSINVGGSPTVPDSEAAGPVPRLPDGHVDLTGPWVGGGTNDNMEEDAGMKKGELDALLLPWARELKARRKPQDEPYTACLPMGVPRVNPYPWKFAMSYTSKGLTHIYVLHETGDAGAHRVVYMDGRKHPDPDRLLPTWFGHSIGRFDKDSLVIDTIGYNDKFWFDLPGTPHTEQLHTVERWTRINYGRITNDLTIDDPGAFSKTLQLKFTARLLKPNLKVGGGDLMEFICLENNEYGSAGNFRPGTGVQNK